MRLTKIAWMLSVALMGFGVHFRIEQQKFAARSVPVTAEVLSVTSPDSDHRTPRAARIGIRYELEGRIFRSSRSESGRSWKGLAVGDPIELLVDREKPQNFIAAADDVKGRLHLGSVMIGVGALLPVLALRFRPRR